MNAITTSNEGYNLLTLPDLSARIWDESTKASKAAQNALAHAVRCGEMLQAAKAKIPHGSWAKWIEDNTELTHRTANAYMSLASNSQRVANLDSIRGALKLLSDEKAEERKREISETYIPYDGEPSLEPPAPKAPAPPSRPAASKVIDAEVIEQPKVVETFSLGFSAEWLKQRRAELMGESEPEQAPPPPAEVIETEPDEMPSWSRLATQFFVLTYADKVAFLNHINSKFKP